MRTLSRLKPFPVPPVCWFPVYDSNVGFQHVRADVLPLDEPEPRKSISPLALPTRAGFLQSVVSRLEDPDYGKVSIQTVLEGAAAFEYVSFPEFLRRTRDVSTEALQAESFNEQQLRPITPNAVTISFGNRQTIANIYQSLGVPIEVMRGTPQGSAYLPSAAMN